MVRYSLNTRATKPETIQGFNGYGYATQGMLKSWKSLDFDWGLNDKKSDVGLVFDQPQFSHFYDGQYKIFYMPWESTLLMDGWSDIMNGCDEIWTPSPLIARWYQEYAGIERPVHVYEHGIDHVWTPVKREPTDHLKFLIVGAESTRKNGWQALNYFKQTFAARDDVSVTMKMINSSWNGIPRIGKTTFINEIYSFDRLQELFYDHHVLLHLSSGEGFGLPPLQAIASGMPVITLPAWAPYAQFLDPNLTVDSKLVKSPWEIHPGMIFRPDADQFKERMLWVVDNYEKAAEFAFNTAPLVHERYDWDTITSKVFGDLEKRLK